MEPERKRRASRSRREPVDRDQLGRVLRREVQHQEGAFAHGGAVGGVPETLRHPTDQTGDHGPLAADER